MPKPYITKATKLLKFRRKLAEMILIGQKSSTWRLFDDKDLRVGDVAEFLIWEDLKPFAMVEITKVIETTLGKLPVEERSGHEVYSSDKKMYEEFSNYYKRPVGSDSPVKIIHFKLLEKL